MVARSRYFRLILSIILGTVWCISGAASPAPPALAQYPPAPCGIAEGFEFPVADIDTHTTDFGIYRARWGGLHTGIDVAFGQIGLPVRAAARGEVTFSNIEGWDTEKGVVVIQHTLADGSVVNSLYGHMEEQNGLIFPTMGQCIEQGAIVGTVGSPSLSRPHLHYEVRMRYRHEGGPGYTDASPLGLGWLHPVDFTFLSRVIVLPAYRDHFTLIKKPIIPPLLMADGSTVTAHSDQIVGRNAAGEIIWQFDILATATGLYALGDGRTLVSQSDGRILILTRGRTSALWQAALGSLAPVLLPDDTLAVATDSSTLVGYAPDGVRLWETAPFPAPITRLITSGDRIALTTTDQQIWIFDSRGNLLSQRVYQSTPVIVSAPGSAFTLVDGATIYHVDSALTERIIVDPARPTTSGATLFNAGDLIFLYTGEGRALYAYDLSGALRWIGYMPGSHSQPPLLAMGGGTRLYVLTADGQLLAYSVEDGHLLGQTALYDGGAEGSSAARWLQVTPDDLLRFSSGFLSVVTLDGLALDSAAR